MWPLGLIGALTLGHDNRLDLDRPVNDYFMRATLAGCFTYRMTAAALMSHTAEISVGAFPVMWPGCRAQALSRC